VKAKVKSVKQFVAKQKKAKKKIKFLVKHNKTTDIAFRSCWGRDGQRWEKVELQLKRIYVCNENEKEEEKENTWDMLANIMRAKSWRNNFLRLIEGLRKIKLFNGIKGKKKYIILLKKSN
jgi:hypothetical protein